MKASSALVSGLAGATVLTATHEVIRQFNSKAPRMDLLGMQAISKALKKVDWKRPSNLYLITMAGDLIANSLYYSAAGIGGRKSVWVRGAALGLAAGLGAVLLPKPLGLNENHSSRTVTTKVLTVGLYVAGALVTTAVLRALDRKNKKREQDWEQRLMTSAMS
jgi:hypothetical protein